MSRTTSRPAVLDADFVDHERQRAEEDAAATILAMLTSGRIEPECVCNGDGAPLSVATAARIGMWF